MLHRRRHKNCRLVPLEHHTQPQATGGKQVWKPKKHTKKSKIKINQTWRRSTVKPKAAHSPLRAGLIASKVAQRPGVESCRLSPRNFKARPSLPVSWGSRSNVASPEERALECSPGQCSKILPLPCGSKTLVREKPWLWPAQNSATLPHAELGVLKGEKLLTLNNLEEKNKASVENSGNWMKL